MAKVCVRVTAITVRAFGASSFHGNGYLGVNKMGKNIRKSPLHQPNYASTSNSNPVGAGRPQPQPQVYSISKNDFRSFVQQHTGSPARDPLPRPLSNPPRPASMRLQRIRPPPLTPINRPPMGSVAPGHAPPVQLQPPSQDLAMHPAQIPFAYNAARPPQFGQPLPGSVHPPHGVNPGWVNPALSPTSDNMQQLQSLLGDTGPRQTTQGQPSLLPQIPGQVQARTPSEPQFPGQAHAQWPSSSLLPSPTVPPVPSPRMNSPGLLPSPSFWPSPSAFRDLWTPPPRSPYPLLSPGNRFPPPLSPNFSFGSMHQPGILGPDFWYLVSPITHRFDEAWSSHGFVNNFTVLPETQKASEYQRRRICRKGLRGRACKTNNTCNLQLEQALADMELQLLVCESHYKLLATSKHGCVSIMMSATYISGKKKSTSMMMATQVKEEL
ncbi:HAIKU1-like protein [Drosera capensis]